MHCKTLFSKNDYKNKGFEYIDNLSPVNKKLETELNEELIKKIKKNEIENIWAAVPDDMNWEDLEGFYCGRKNDVLADDIDLELFLVEIDLKKSFHPIIKK